MNWQQLLEHMARWQFVTFPATTTWGARNHLEREVVKELKEKPNDPEEWADALFMTIQGGTKAAGSLEGFRLVVQDKLAKNENRTWPDKPDADNVYEHVKDEPEPGRFGTSPWSGL